VLPHRSGFEGSSNVRRKRTRLRVNEGNRPSQPFRVSDSNVSKGLHVRSAINIEHWWSAYSVNFAKKVRIVSASALIP